MSAPAALLQSWPHKYGREGLLPLEGVLHWLIPEGLKDKERNLTGVQADPISVKALSLSLMSHALGLCFGKLMEFNGDE